MLGSAISLRLLLPQSAIAREPSLRPNLRASITGGAGPVAAQEGSIWKTRVYHWRAAMEYFLIGMWRQCVPLLDQYDVVGAISPFRTVHPPKLSFAMAGRSMQGLP